jgi:hypothetical protein
MRKTLSSQIGRLRDRHHPLLDQHTLAAITVARPRGHACDSSRVRKAVVMIERRDRGRMTGSHSWRKRPDVGAEMQY